MENTGKNDPSESLGRLAAQVIHDLQPPLAALQMLEQHLHLLPEPQRMLLTSARARIRDVVERLNQQRAALKKEPQPEPTPAREALREIAVPARSEVIVLDDDVTIHHVWKERFQQAGFAARGVSVRFYSSPGDFTDLITESGADLSRTLFLIDHDFEGHKVTGLALIESLNLSQRAILVTGRDTDAEIRRSCESRGVRLLGKSRLTEVPILVTG